MTRKFWLACVCLLTAASSLGAQLVKNVNAVPRVELSGGGDFLESAAVARGTLFVMDDYVHGGELWITDGTPGGTQLVKDINPGPLTSSIQQMTLIAGVAYFFSDDGANGTELWRSDGTAVGTTMVANIGSGAQGFGGPLVYGGFPLTTANGVMYFTAVDAAGEELWRSDGSANGTYRLKDITAGATGSDIEQMLVVGSHLFFIVVDSSGGALWVSDGTEAGTRRVSNYPAGTNPGIGQFTVAGNTLYFTADDNIHGRELWRVDVDGNNLAMVVDLNSMKPLDDASKTLSADPRALFALGGRLVFTATTMTGPSQQQAQVFTKMYGLDAGSSKPIEIMDTPFGVTPENPIVTGNSALFEMTGPASNAWVTDGTTAGTQNLQYVNFEYVTGTAVVHRGGQAFFFARTQVSAPGYDLWVTDGTAAGTHVYVALNVAFPSDLVDFNGQLLFERSMTGLGRELWSTDGTVGGTHVVRDVIAGDPGGDPSAIKVVGGKLYFTAYNADFSGGEPWVSDGTGAGTVRLAAVTTRFTDDGSDPETLGQLGGKLIFTAEDGVHGRELWVSDGSDAGTQLLRDINPGVDSSSPSGFVAMNGFALFAARDASGIELWRTDGTTAGTLRVKDINPGAGDSLEYGLTGQGTVLAGIAYFIADDGVNGRQLWRSDGTAAGTTLAVTIGPLPNYVSLMPATANGRLFLLVSGDPPTIYSTDGTQGGTVVVSNTLNIQSVDLVAAYHGRVCFSVLLLSQDSELYCSNGTAGSAVKITDFAAQSLLSVSRPYVINDKLVVAAYQRGLVGGGTYTSDGTIAGLTKISDLHIDDGGIPISGGARYAFMYLGGANADIFVTDGTTAGTHSMLTGATLARESIEGPFGSFDDSVVFAVRDEVRGHVLWKTDGTPAGTHYLADVNPVDDANETPPIQFMQVGPRLYFNAFRERIGAELWSLSANEPNASDEFAATAFGTAVAIDVLANDAVFAGSLSAANVEIVSAPTSGMTSVNAATGAITYTPNAGFAGLDAFTYRVGDGAGHFSNAANVQVTVRPQVSSSGPGTAPVPAPPTPPPTTPPSTPTTPAKSGGGGALGFELLLLLPLLFVKRQRQRQMTRKSR